MTQKAPKSKYTDAFKEYIYNVGLYCKQGTFHGEYEAKYIFMEEPFEEDSRDEATYMTIRTDSVYLNVTIRIYPECMEKYKKKDYRFLGETMLHEWCHVFLEPVIHDVRGILLDSMIRHILDNTLERQTQRVCNAIACGFPSTWYLPNHLAKWASL